MTADGNLNRRSTVCVDKDPEAVPGEAANTDGALFYHMEATCNGLDCPPYDPTEGANLCCMHQIRCNCTNSEHSIYVHEVYNLPTLTYICTLNSILHARIQIIIMIIINVCWPLHINQSRI